MSSEKSPQDPSLDASLRRVQEALSKGFDEKARVFGALLEATGALALDRVNRRLAYRLERRARKEAKRREKEARRRDQGPVAGIVFAVAAVAMGYLAFTNHDLWWMVFIAFGFSFPAVGGLASLFRRKKALPEGADGKTEGSEQGAAAPEKSPVVEARIARVNATCDKLLNEIRTGPKVVREFVRKPEETLNALRKTCHDLARREEGIRAAVADADESRLRHEREGLTSRIETEKDEVVRSRLQAAVSALDGQLAQLAELGTAASRLEAESTRILYTLENLHAQVLRVRSADSASADVAGAGLRQSLDQLSQEIDSVAEALESVNREGSAVPALSAVTEVSSDSASPARKREREG